MNAVPTLRFRGYLVEATRKNGTRFICGHRKESWGPNRGHWLGGYSEPVLFSSSTMARTAIKKCNEHYSRRFRQRNDMSYRVISVVFEVKLGMAAGPGRAPDEPGIRAEYKEVRPRKQRAKKSRSWKC